MPGAGTSAGSNWLVWLAVAQIITWCIAIAGWIWADRRDNLRDTRKDIRGDLDRLRTDVDSLRDKAICYYTSPNGDKTRELETEIKIRFGRLQFDASSIARRLSVSIEDSLANLMEPLTGGDFETATRQPCPHNSELVLTIAATCEVIINQLEHAFVETYTK